LEFNVPFQHKYVYITDEFYIVNNYRTHNDDEWTVALNVLRSGSYYTYNK